MPYPTARADRPRGPVPILPAEAQHPDRALAWALTALRDYADPSSPPPDDDDSRWLGRYLYALARYLRKREHETPPACCRWCGVQHDGTFRVTDAWYCGDCRDRGHPYDGDDREG